MSPFARFLLSGVIGIGAAVVVSAIAWFAPLLFPILFDPARVGAMVARIFLLILGLIAVVEMPMMLFVIIQMIRRNTSAGALDLVQVSYVFFPAIYALMGTALTGYRWWIFMMFFLVLMRFAMSILAFRFASAEKAPRPQKASEPT